MSDEERLHREYEKLLRERIEELEAKCVEYHGLFVHWRGEADGLRKQLKDAEAKLAKAVELLRKHCDPMDMSDADVALLAEIEGEKT